MLGVLLQNALSKFVLDRFRNGTLGIITADEVKRAAFKSHAAAYTEGGLTMVCILAPILVLHVMRIPGDEFLPWKPNARASWSQALETSGLATFPGARCS